MIYEPIRDTTQNELQGALCDYLDALGSVGGDPVKRAIVNLIWQAWLFKYQGDHDPYVGLPVTAAMVGDMQERCEPVIREMYGDDPARGFVGQPVPIPWQNPKGDHVCACGYCRGIITHKRDKADEFHVIGNGEIEIQ